MKKFNRPGDAAEFLEKALPEFIHIRLWGKDGVEVATNSYNRNNLDSPEVTEGDMETAFDALVAARRKHLSIDTETRSVAGNVPKDKRIIGEAALKLFHDQKGKSGGEKKG